MAENKTVKKISNQVYQTYVIDCVSGISILGSVIANHRACALESAIVSENEIDVVVVSEIESVTLEKTNL